MAGSGTGPYDGLGDEEVLARAATALRKVLGYPMGSVQRAVQWAVYDAATAELDRRLGQYLAAHPLAALAEAARRGRTSMTGQPQAATGHEAEPAAYTAYSMTGPNTGSPANLANARHFPAEGICAGCGGVVRAERHDSGWAHTGRIPGDP